MSPIIRISNELYDRLKAHAEPFVDSPSSVIERVLDAYEAGRKGGTMTKTISTSSEQCAVDQHRDVPKHPDYADAHPGSQRLHDAVVQGIESRYGTIPTVKSFTLLFEDGIVFAAIEQLTKRSPGVGLSLAGAPKDFNDPKRLLRPGRRPDHYSRLKVTSDGELAYAFELIAQAHAHRK